MIFSLPHEKLTNYCNQFLMCMLINNIASYLREQSKLTQAVMLLVLRVISCSNLDWDTDNPCSFFVFLVLQSKLHGIMQIVPKL
jgi:hypothetical protein